MKVILQSIWGLDPLLQTIVAESDVFSKEVSSTINSTVCLLIITLTKPLIKGILILSSNYGTE